MQVVINVESGISKLRSNSSLAWTGVFIFTNLIEGKLRILNWKRQWQTTPIFFRKSHGTDIKEEEYIENQDCYVMKGCGIYR